ncbi:hypothetical protein BJ508DRAFT_79239 [Ascobolus immersus RN42]|uniref:Uncharacterized protein n=1 Tax=Ascobolus immersus RN42 TaxID=1160509 RepID=A0A3N4HCP4_ASCIM|nr:hypothetical protein BJ508DRAFT_79239 [Ascobolus immersus RN42]
MDKKPSAEHTEHAQPGPTDYGASAQSPDDKAALLRAAQDEGSVFHHMISTGYGIRCRHTGAYFNMMRDGTMCTQVAPGLQMEDMVMDPDGSYWFKKERAAIGARTRMPEKQVEFMDDPGEYYEM